MQTLDTKLVGSCLDEYKELLKRGLGHAATCRKQDCCCKELFRL